MSKIYAEKYGLEHPDLVERTQMRKHCQRPGKTDSDGNILYFTEQNHKQECDINSIIRKYDKNGLINHVSNIEAKFGDVTGIEFQTAQNKVLEAKKMFGDLPSNIRKRFGNNPSELLSFLDDPGNRSEAETLGLIRADWSDDTDGLGEHIKEPKQRKKKVEPVSTE